MTKAQFGAGRVARLLFTLCATSIRLASSTDIKVHAGDSIQAAVDKAQSGDRVIVYKGNYTEQVTISTNGISLVGQGAILYRPSTPKSNTCSGLAGPGTEAGICVTGSDIVLADYASEHRKVISVGACVKDVSVTGFEVHSFSGLNIAVIGAENAKVAHNHLIDGNQYGLLTVGSKGTTATANVVTSASLDFIAICMDDYKDVDVSHNTISNYYIGLCVQTDGANVQHNHVSNVCVGAYVDPGVHGAVLHRNDIYNTNPICDMFGDNTFASGIVIDGAVGTDVRDNDIEGQVLTVPGKTAAGVLLFDDENGDISSGNNVIGNTLKDNQANFLVFSSGTGNVFSKNKCATVDYS